MHQVDGCEKCCCREVQIPIHIHSFESVVNQSFETDWEYCRKENLKDNICNISLYISTYGINQLLQKKTFVANTEEGTSRQILAKSCANVPSVLSTKRGGTFARYVHNWHLVFQKTERNERFANAREAGALSLRRRMHAASHATPE